MSKLYKILLVLVLASFCQCQSITKQDASSPTVFEVSKAKEIPNASRIIHQSDLETELIKAVTENNESEIAELLKRGADPNTALWKKYNLSDEEFIGGETVLSLAVSGKNLAVAEILLKNKANVNVASVKVNTGDSDNLSINKAMWLSSPLKSAVANNDIPMMKLLVSYKIDVEKANSGRDLYKLTSEEKTIKTLKEIGVNIDRIDESNGMNAMMEAVRYDNYDKIKLLAKYGADVNVRTDNGCSIWGFLAEDKDKKISKLLKKLGAKNREKQCPDEPTAK